MTLQHYDDIINSPENSLSLKQLRDGIDEIDAQLLDLLSKRLDIVKKVGRYKDLHPSDSKVVIRPGREAQLFRKLIASNKDDYLPQALVKIWRGIISTALRVEQDLSVVAHSPNGNMNTYWLAQDYFGANLSTTVKSDSKQILDDLTQSQSLIAFFGPLDMEQKWWIHLAEISPSEGLFVFLKLPLVPSLLNSPHTLLKEPEAYAVSRIIPEDSGHDSSLWVIQSDDSWANLAKTFSSQALQVQLLDQAPGYYLMAIDGFIISKQASQIQEILDSDLQLDLNCIGAYATDIIDA